MRPARIIILLTWGIALAFSTGAMAISTLQDTLRDLPRISRTPSTYPPNSEVHRDFTPRQSNGHTPDTGPGRDDPLVTIPASFAPWVVAISSSKNLSEDFVCAGTLIAPHWVVTAAHCTFSIAQRWPNDLEPYVFTGTVDLSAPQHSFKVRQIVPHPEYDPKTLRNDIALIRIEPDTTDLPLSLDGAPASQMVGEITTIFGWGISTNQANQGHTEKLQILQNTISSEQVCFSDTHFPLLVNTGVFCGRSMLKYHDVCFGFGGSPVVTYSPKGVNYLAGIVSWPATCPSDSTRLNIFLDAQFYRPWIQSVIGNS